MRRCPGRMSNSTDQPFNSPRPDCSPNLRAVCQGLGPGIEYRFQALVREVCNGKRVAQLLLELRVLDRKHDLRAEYDGPWVPTLGHAAPGVEVGEGLVICAIADRPAANRAFVRAAEYDLAGKDEPLTVLSLLEKFCHLALPKSPEIILTNHFDIAELGGREDDLAFARFGKRIIDEADGWPNCDNGGARQTASF